MIAAGGAPFEVIKSSEEFYRLEAVADVCAKQVPCAFVFALLVVGETFVWVIVIEVYVTVGVVRVDFYAGVKVECVCEFPVGEKADGRGIVVMRFCFREIRDHDGI